MKRCLKSKKSVILSVLFLFLVEITVSQEYADEPSCSSRTLEMCTKDLLRYSSEDVKVPETVEEVKENCA